MWKGSRPEYNFISAKQRRFHILMCQIWKQQSLFLTQFPTSGSASTMLVWLGARKSIRPVKNWVLSGQHGYLSEARCKWFAYSPVNATATPSSLASSKYRRVLSFWCRLTQVVVEEAVKGASVSLVNGKQCWGQAAGINGVVFISCESNGGSNDGFDGSNEQQTSSTAWRGPRPWLASVHRLPFAVSTPLVGQSEGHLASKIPAPTRSTARTVHTSAKARLTSASGKSVWAATLCPLTTLHISQ